MPRLVRRPVLNQHDFSHYPAVIQRVLAARELESSHALDFSLKHLADFRLLKDIDTAVTLLKTALAEQQRIVIVADYDADGATSCALAVQALSWMGAQAVDYFVPDREKHGYGLTAQIVDLLTPFQPDLLITVDNGIASLEGVKAAKVAGMQVLVTDHHLAPEQLPNADAIINPNQPGDTFPSKNLAGVGVIFYVMAALRTALRAEDWFAQHKVPEPNLAALLDLVALGTVADVVKLDHNNRILVEQGLKRIRANQCCPGIRALIQAAKREQSTLVASDLAFALGPRLNAAGRLDNMKYGVECLLAVDETSALEHAQYLDSVNQERRFVEQDIQAAAFNKLKSMGLDQHNDELPIGLCLYDAEWHQGVVGIVASRVKDRLHRPVIVFGDGGDDCIKGSARSVNGVHIRDVLANIATQYPDLLQKFGGHAMAAGLTLRRADFLRFQQIFDAAVRPLLSAEQIQGVIETDGELESTDFCLALAETLRDLTPWGQGFPEPLFIGEFDVLERRVLKERHLKLQVRPCQGGMALDAIAFNTPAQHCPEQAKRVTLAYKLDVNFYRGFKNLQLVAVYVSAVEA